MMPCLCSSLIIIGRHAFLDLAAENLQSLSLDLSRPCCSPRIAELTRLTELTRLELLDDDNWRAAPPCFKPLRDLPLQELVILGFSGPEKVLFVPGALSTLRRLHIEDASCLKKSQGDGQLELDDECALERAAEQIFQLPELYQVSGKCDLFEFAMKQGLKTWREADCQKGLMVTYKGFHSCHEKWMKVWTKPNGQS